jgi:ferredoxin
MKFSVDHTKCNSSGRCVVNFPELFRFNEGSKKAVAIGSEIPEPQDENAKIILRVCPVGAIKAIDEITNHSYLNGKGLKINHEIINHIWG